ncbi:MAG: adenylosuccinate synthase, partial [Chloroflexi bacterium]|nr:adenylosuccinate synthase [Chloroflexota bacterium]
MSVVVVIGAQWGDEGKGKIVDHLAERAAMVVRYQGGNNAGHTVVIGDRVLKLHQVPSGITRPRVAAVLGHGMVINPPALVEELDMLAANAIATDNLHISANAHVVMPYHILLDKLVEQRRGRHAIGTTMRGIGPAYTDKYARRGLRIQDLVDPERFRARTALALERVNLELTRLYDHPALALDEVVDAYAPAAERIRPFVADTGLLLHQALQRGEPVLMEGAQGTMLDIDVGTYPFVTSSSPSAGGASQGSGMGPTRIAEVLGVVKAYTSRVGAGPFPSELLDDTGDWIREKGHEYGTTTGRPRRCGWLDVVSLRYAARINGFTGLAITRLDILSGLPEVKICIGYRLPDGTVTEDYPVDTEILGQVEAVYESWPGWDAAFGAARTWQDLPASAQAYCERVAALL